MNEFENKVAVVTGGARGIGREIATSLARSGAHVVLIDAPEPMVSLAYQPSGASDLKEAAEAIRASGGTCTTYELDVRSRQRVGEVVQMCLDDVGRVDMLVSCAGVSSVVDAGDMDDASWSEVVDTNLHGFFHMVRALTPHMVERGSGSVLAVVGDEARRGMAGVSHASAAGWAVIGLAKSLALETAASGIAVNVLCVGPVDTAMTASAEYRSAAADVREVLEGDEVLDALGRRHPNNQVWVPMHDVVRAAGFLLASGTASTGSVLDVSAGLSALNSS